MPGASAGLRGIGRLRIGAAVAFLLGLAVAIALLAWQGFQAVGEAVWAVGWGMLPIIAVRVFPVLAMTLAWRIVLAPSVRVDLGVLYLLRCIRDAVNALLPVAQVGGDVVGARLLALRGVDPGVAGASVLVDKTMDVLTQFVFALTGVLLLVAHGRSTAFVDAVALGLLLMLPLLLGFVGAQWLGLGRLLEALAARLAGVLGRAGPGLSGMHDTLRALYRDPLRCAQAFALHLLSWALGAVEVWIALWCMGRPVSLVEAFVIESLGQAVRSAAFFVPASVGAQEAGYLLAGTAVGLAPETGLALSLIKRFRELLLGVPLIVVWQGMEGRRLLRARPAPEG